MYIVTIIKWCCSVTAIEIIGLLIEASYGSSKTLYENVGSHLLKPRKHYENESPPNTKTNEIIPRRNTNILQLVFDTVRQIQCSFHRTQ